MTDKNLSAYKNLKEKHPDAVLLFRVGDVYESYHADADTCVKVLGLEKFVCDDIPMVSFPYHRLDTYLPQLVRAGNRVAICDQLETPNK
ncbi:MAG: hypothetical protein HUK07_07180 [Bacteroidaceae bacterium]|nr:hypothetical protein [Bacteroidaceae bacterium]